jgi:hypothetical protein
VLYKCLSEEGRLQILSMEENSSEHQRPHFFGIAPPDQESYDACMYDYISKLATEPLDQSCPLWVFHFMNYKTSKDGSTFFIKLDPSLRYGICFMSTLFSWDQRVDNPILQANFPTVKCSYTRSMTTSKQSIVVKYFHRLWYLMILIWYTFIDVVKYLLRKTGWIADRQIPFRGPP